MIILEYNIYAFGNIVSREGRFGEGLNVVSCDSREEAESVRDFMLSLLYGLGGRTGGGFRKKYYPGAMFRFGGELKLESSGRQYLISAVFGRTPETDNVRLFELPAARLLPVPNGKTIGEMLFNVTEAGFRSAFELWPETAGDCVGYLTPVLSFDRDKNWSYVAAGERLEARLRQIKNTADKSGELDKLVIMKMESGNTLARLSENDQKIAAEKQQLEQLKAQKHEQKALARAQLRKIEIAESCENLLLKDKIQNSVASVRASAAELEKLERKTAYLDSQKREGTYIIPGIIGFAAVVLLLLALKLGLFALIGGLLLLAAAAALLIIKLIKFRNRYLIVRDGVKTHILSETDSVKRKLSEETDRLLSYLNGKTYFDYEEIRRKAEEVLRNASEDERRNAVLQKSDSDRELYEEMISAVSPIEDKINATKLKIDELSANLSEAYTVAQASLQGIDDKIRELSDEYHVTSIASENMKKAEKEISGELLPSLFGDAVKIFEEAYGDEGIVFEADDDFTVRVKGKANGSLPAATLERAKFALKAAASKKLLVSESGVVLCGIGKLPESITEKRLPLDVRQVICFDC